MSETERHTGKAGVEHTREHCRPRWCGEFPPEGHPLAATAKDRVALALGKSPTAVYNGAYKGLTVEQLTAGLTAEQVNAKLLKGDEDRG